MTGKRNSAPGFTLIELLVVIAIIGILAAVVLGSLDSARKKADTAAVQSQLRSILNGMEEMLADTGKLPYGCEPEAFSASGNEVDLSIPESGLYQKPTVGTHGSNGCAWTQADIDKWHGPYMSTKDLKDPWGNDYWLDNDYYARRDCPTMNANPSAPAIVAIASDGPNGVGGATNDNYDCDDIYLQVPSL